jgi:hypothetical protein
MKAYRRLIAVLGAVLFFLAANALMHERDTNNTGPLLKLPLDIYEPRQSGVIVIGLLTLCPLIAIVNHLGWIIAVEGAADPRLQRVATFDEFHPRRGFRESVVYSLVFAVVYHLFPIGAATALFTRLFIEAPPGLLWDGSVGSLFSGNHARFEGLSYYGWMTILLIALYGLAVASFVRLGHAVLKPAAAIPHLA